MFKLNHIYSFTDYYNNNVEFSYGDHFFSQDPRHVWVICKKDDQWLLTEHKERGIEFPGGKVEKGETAKEAAHREIYEETGGIAKTLDYIGQYKVTGKNETVIKNVYFATIHSLEEKEHYYETNGPLFLKELPKQLKREKDFSFIMKDDVLFYSMNWVKEFLDMK